MRRSVRATGRPSLICLLVWSDGGKGEEELEKCDSVKFFFFLNETHHLRLTAPNDTVTSAWRWSQGRLNVITFSSIILMASL